MQDKLPPLPAMSSGLSCLQLAQPVVHVGRRCCLLFSILVMQPATWDPSRCMGALHRAVLLGCCHTARVASHMLGKQGSEAQPWQLQTHS
jgi:hypothetical protein